MIRFNFMRATRASALCIAIALGAAIALPLAASGTVSAQPVNDDYDTALDITDIRHIYGSTEDATIENGEPDVTSTKLAERSIWYKYVAPETGYLVVISADQGFSGINPYIYAIDAFRGTSFKASNRIAVGLGEDLGGGMLYTPNLIRFVIPTTKGETYHIRVAQLPALGWGDSREFSIQTVQFGGQGGMAVVPVKYSEGSNGPALLLGRATSYVESYYRSEYFLINTLTTAATASLTTSIPSGYFQYTSQLVPARAGTKPGLQIAALDWSNEPYSGQVGTWYKEISARMQSGGTFIKPTFPIAIQKYRTDRAKIDVVTKTSRLSAKVGTWTTFKVSIRNTSGFDANACRVYNVNGDGTIDFTWRPDLPDASWGQTFKVPANQTRAAVVRVRPSYVGTANNFGVYVVCNETDRTWNEQDITIVGEP